MVLLGVIHCFFTLFTYRELSQLTLWILAEGLILVYGGAFNLVRIRYPNVDGLRRTCLGVNLVLLGYAVALAAYTLPRNAWSPLVWLLLGLCGLATWFSSRRRGDSPAGRMPV